MFQNKFMVCGARRNLGGKEFQMYRTCAYLKKGGFYEIQGLQAIWLDADQISCIQSAL